MNSEKISVVIPLYNKSRHIFRTLLSIVHQKQPVGEVIVVDDGSTDDGVSVVNKFIDDNQVSNLIRVVSQNNSGVSRARNVGVSYSKGDYVAFIDADDTWSAHFVEEIVNLISHFPSAGAFSTSYQKVIGESEFIDPKIRCIRSSKSFIIDNFFEICGRGDLPFVTSSICIKRNVFEDLSGFPEGEPMGEDQDLWSRLALFSTIAYSPKVLSFYHLDADNRVCNSNIPDVECPFSKRLNDYVKHNSLSDQLSKNILRYTSTHIINLARMNIKIGKFEAARLLLKDSRCNLLFSKYMLCKANLWFRVLRTKLYWT